jgi:acyl carrier protein
VNQEIFEKVRDILAKHLSKDPASIQIESHLIKDLQADSLDTVDVLLQIEEEFSVRIPEEEQENIQTVGHIVQYIEKHQTA